MVIGNASHSVLKSLSKRLANTPTVILRENGEAEGKVVQLGSKEFSTKQSDSRYQLHGEIARGGMGAIIKGRDTDLGRDLAIKVLLDEHKDNPEMLQRFVEEAQIGGHALELASMVATFGNQNASIVELHIFRSFSPTG